MHAAVKSGTPDRLANFTVVINRIDNASDNRDRLFGIEPAEPKSTVLSKRAPDGALHEISLDLGALPRNRDRRTPVIGFQDWAVLDQKVPAVQAS
jgi:hypothetical protein|tara:strand:+ start:843 stop:1127 length:285 start_codon:yes stop_codon:yes gene_type:complete